MVCRHWLSTHVYLGGKESMMSSCYAIVVRSITVAVFLILMYIVLTVKYAFMHVLEKRGDATQ